MNVTSIGGYANWTNVSDARFKKNISSEGVKGLNFITALRPVTYNMNMEAMDDWRVRNYQKEKKSKEELNFEKEQTRYSGFIAQEVEAAANSTDYDFSGVDAPKNDKDFYGLRYAEFVVPLVKAVQELNTTIENQKQQIIELQNQEQQIIELQNQVQVLLSKNKKP